MKNRAVLLFNMFLVPSLLAMSACGGGGGGGGTPPPPPVNVAPVANAGDDQTAASNSGTVTLTGSGTDSDGTISSYSWSTTSSVSLTNGDTATSTFSAPSINFGDADLIFTFTLTVTDDDGASATDDVLITVTAPTEPTAVVDTAWDLLNHAPSAYKIAFNGTKYIAVGAFGYIAESTDGLTWSSFDVGSIISFDDLAVNGNNAVVISAGVSESMAVTTDGVNWQLMEDSGNAQCGSINSINHDGSQFVGLFDYSQICTSTDGTSWQLQSSQTINMQRIISGSNIHAILISDGLVTIDSLNPTTINVPSLPVSSSGGLRDLIYGNSTFLGLRQGELIYSTDGANWSIVSGGIVPANVISISYSASKGFVAMTNDNATLLYISADAVSWTQVTNDLPLLSGWFGTIINGGTESLLFNNDKIQRSLDLATWNLASLENQPTGEVNNYFTHNNTIFILAGTSASIFNMSTDNGASWSVSDNVQVGSILSLTHDGTRFIASGTDGVSTSDDGISWIKAISYQMSRPLLASAELGSTTYYFSYTGNFDSEKSVLSSDDGISFQVDSGLFEVIPSNFLGGVKQVASNGSLLVGITNNSIVSYDGSWDLNAQNVGDLTDVIWTGSQFVVVGSGGLVMTSPDAGIWTNQTWFNFTATITDVLAVGSNLYATDSDGIIASSDDNGVTWVERKDFSTSGNIISQLAHDGTSFYGFGRNAGLSTMTLATSADGIIWGASSAVFDNIIPDHHVNYETSNSRFISTYYASDSDQIYASTNAATWALTSEIPTDASYAYIAAQKDLAPLRYGSVNVDNSNYTSGSAAYSTNGLDWIIKTDQMFYSGYTPQSGIYASGYGNGNSIGTKNGSVGRILVSSDGITYADAVLNGLTSDNIEFKFIKYVNNQYVGIQVNTDNGDLGIYTSTDGSNWTLQVEADFAPLWDGLVSDIEHDGTQYLILSRSDKGAMILKTPDLQNIIFIETGIRAHMTDLIVEANGYVLTGFTGVIASHARY